MKPLVTLGLAFLSCVSMAGAAAHGVPSKPGIDAAMATHVMADASRLGADMGDTAAVSAAHALPAGMRWSPDRAEAAGSRFSAPDEPLDTGPLAVVLGVAALLLTRPLGRALRRQEQQRRAAALASAIAQSPRR